MSTQMTALAGGLKVRVQVVDGDSGTDYLSSAGMPVLYGAIVGVGNNENTSVSQLAIDFDGMPNLAVSTTTSANNYKIVGLIFGV